MKDGECRPTRMHFDQPSTLQPHHALDGRNGFAICDGDMARFYPVEGAVVSMRVPWLSLAPGWRTPQAKTCATCRHWARPISRTAEYGECLKAGSGEAMQSDGYAFITRPGFGCVLHEVTP